MAHEYTTWAYKQDLPSAMKFVLVALADRANHEGYCWPSCKDLAKMTGQTERSVMNQIKALVEKGFLKKEKRYRKGGYRSSNGYTLLKNPELFLDKTVSGENNSGEIISSENDDNSYMKEVQSNIYPTGISEPSSEPSDIKPSKFNDEFEELWKIYIPLKTGKGNKQTAKENYQKIRKKGVTHATLIDSCRKYIEFCHSQDEYTMHVSRWLDPKKCRWRDDYTISASKPGSCTGTGRDQNKEESFRNRVIGTAEEIDLLLEDANHQGQAYQG